MRCSEIHLHYNIHWQVIRSSADAEDSSFNCAKDMTGSTKYENWPPDKDLPSLTAIHQLLCDWK